MPKFFNVLITAHRSKSYWAVRCLKQGVDASEVPEAIHFDGVDFIFVAWASDADLEFPIYLQVAPDMSKRKQLFALATSLQQFRKEGYTIEC